MDINIDIFKNDHIDIDIDIDIFQKCRYIDNRYVISIYRTGLVYSENFCPFTEVPGAWVGLWQNDLGHRRSLRASDSFLLSISPNKLSGPLHLAPIWKINTLTANQPHLAKMTSLPYLSEKKPCLEILSKRITIPPVNKTSICKSN